MTGVFLCIYRERLLTEIIWMLFPPLQLAPPTGSEIALFTLCLSELVWYTRENLEMELQRGELMPVVNRCQQGLPLRHSFVLSCKLFPYSTYHLVPLDSTMILCYRANRML